ncbi:hypothetical protein PCE1_000070 [Barthelona sp. PCE]
MGKQRNSKLSDLFLNSRLFAQRFLDSSDFGLIEPLLRVVYIWIKELQRYVGEDLLDYCHGFNHIGEVGLLASILSVQFEEHVNIHSAIIAGFLHDVGKTYSVSHHEHAEWGATFVLENQESLEEFVKDVLLPLKEEFPIFASAAHIDYNDIHDAIYHHVHTHLPKNASNLTFIVADADRLTWPRVRRWGCPIIVDYLYTDMGKHFAGIRNRGKWGYPFRNRNFLDRLHMGSCIEWSDEAVREIMTVADPDWGKIEWINNRRRNDRVNVLKTKRVPHIQRKRRNRHHKTT